LHEGENINTLKLGHIQNITIGVKIHASNAAKDRYFPE
jgi:hypothetical protein